jgi:putative two-component system response regulator
MAVDHGEAPAASERLERCEAEILSRLADLFTLRDPTTSAHLQRIGLHAARLAWAHGLDEELVQRLELASSVHDIGKLAIPDAILLKPGPLTGREQELMRRHVQVGYDLLSGSGLPLLDLAAEIALTHHEWFDGTGYPLALAGEEIPIAGRIVAIADSFDFLVSDRPYHAAVVPERAIATLLAERGTHFDPTLLDLFSENLESIVG